MPAIFGTDSTADEVAEQYSTNIRGKVVLTTGVTPGGLGATFVETLAKHKPKLLILAGRNLDKAKKTGDAIAASCPDVEIRYLALDLNSQAQIRKAAEEVNKYNESINVLVNNAGIMAVPYGKTEDGIESQFGVCFIGHFLFTSLILDKILASGPGARIINVSSNGHQLGAMRFDDYNFSDGKTYDKWKAYGQAKTANMLFTVALADKFASRGLLSFSLHPGTIFTNLAGHLEEADYAELQGIIKQLHPEGDGTLSIKSHQQGTATHVYASFSPDISGQNGAYLVDCAVAKSSEVYHMENAKEDAAKLWALGEKLVGQV